jgi:DNA-binding transcriptional MerR regulator
VNGEFRIDELAQQAGTTVRNIRAYQDRGLLPPPRRVGRIGLYSSAHLARLRLIGRMLGRGYSLANIGELLAASARGQSLGDLFGPEVPLNGPWSDGDPTTLSLDELAGLFGEGVERLEAQGVLALVLADGLVGRREDDFVVENLRLLRVGAELAAAGIPVPAFLACRRALHDRIDAVAAAFVDLVVLHAWDPVEPVLPADTSAALPELVRRLRPLAEEAVAAELADALERQVAARLGAAGTRRPDRHGTRAPSTGDLEAP